MDVVKFSIYWQVFSPYGFFLKTKRKMTCEEKIKGYFKNISNPVSFKFDSSVGTESQAWCEL